MSKFWLLLAAFPLPAFSDGPVHACRVKNETLLALATTVNNAGCVLERKNPSNGQSEVLLVHVDKGEKNQGWGIPGGKPATKQNDLKEPSPLLQASAKQIPFDYQEPLVCTAARETLEETGIEVVVEDLLAKETHFAAFTCRALNPEVLAKDLEAIDKKEIQKLAWHSLDDVVNGKLPMRFESNKEILKKLRDKQQ
jgi:ADP-ribose pyrophosphatase YjhB (NUDIX family)